MHVVLNKRHEGSPHFFFSLLSVLARKTVNKAHEVCSYLNSPDRYKQDLGPLSRKSRKLFGFEKPFVKLRPVYSVTLALSYVVNGWKIKITVKFCASRCRRLRHKGNYVTRNAPENFRDFRETGPWSVLISCDLFAGSPGKTFVPTGEWEERRKSAENNSDL